MQSTPHLDLLDVRIREIGKAGHGRGAATSPALEGASSNAGGLLGFHLPRDDSSDTLGIFGHPGVKECGGGVGAKGVAFGLDQSGCFTLREGDGTREYALLLRSNFKIPLGNIPFSFKFFFFQSKGYQK